MDYVFSGNNYCLPGIAKHYAIGKKTVQRELSNSA
jgi:hypothetical protein